MADRIQLKRSDVPGRVPVSADLAVGELAVNTADGKLFVKLADGSVVQVGGSGGGSVVAIQKSQLFTANGTFNRPANIIGNMVVVSQCGGGCSGGFLSGSGLIVGGWSGEQAVDVPVDIGGATSVSCTVGAGGAGSTGLNAAPAAGGTTSFGAFLSTLGGSTTALVGAAPGGSSTSTSSTGAQGADCNYGLAGRITVTGNSRATGAGGFNIKVAPVQLANWGGVMTGAQGYGAGGGAYRDASAGYQAGQGGFILVTWWEAVTL